MVENNPFPDSPPEELRAVDEGLFLYLQELTRLSREAYDRNLYGQVQLSEDILNTFYTEEIYPLGSTAVILHNTFGPMTCRFVEYAQIVVTPLGFPVGIPNNNTSVVEWTVTNDIDISSPSNAFGLLGASRIPKNGEFGWVIVSGPNPYPIKLDLEVGEKTGIGIGLSWVDDGDVGALTTFGSVQGVILGRQVILGEFENEMPAGSFVVTQDAESITTIQAGLQAQIDQLSLDLDGTNATVSTNKLAQVDGDIALGVRIDSIAVISGDNTASIVEESFARVAGDSALAEQITTLDVNLTNEIIASVSQEAAARASEDEALATQVNTVQTSLTARINTNQQTSAKATSDIAALSTRQEASIKSETRLEASLKDGSAENLLETNSESIQIGPLEYTTKLLLSSVGLNPGEAISFGGKVFDPTPHNAESTGWQIEFFDIFNTSLGTVDSDLVSFALLQSADLTADSTLITADSTLFRADMAGPAHRQTPKRENTIIPGMAFSFSFRSLGGAESGNTKYGPVTLVRGPVFRAVNRVTSFASATETLEARVVVNEEGLVVANAKWSVTLDVNGRVTGLVLVDSSETESEFRVLVDKFLVFNNSTDEAVFEINGGVAQMKAANIANLNASKITTGLLIADRISIDGLTLSRLGNDLIIKAAGVDTTQLKNASVTNEGIFTLVGPITMNTVPPATTIIFNQNFVKQEGTTSKLKVEFGCTSTTGAPVAFKNDPGLQFLLDGVVKRNFLVPNPQVTIGNDWTWIIEGLSADTYNIKVTGSDDIGVPFTVKDCYMIITETKK